MTLAFSIKNDFETSPEPAHKAGDSPKEKLVDVAEIVAAAREAQPDWAATPLRDRLALIRRTRHLIASAAVELEDAIRAGRPASMAEPAAEVLSTADACRFLEREAAGILKPKRFGARGRPLWLTGVRTEVRREPFGVVLIIGPSNYPLFLAGVQALQALAAGNAVLFKPGAGGGPVAHCLAGLLKQAGLDPRLLPVLAESPEAAQQAINAGVDKVVLTGSARSGAAVLSQLAPRLIPATLELSGCDAAFVLPDADLDLVTKALGFGLSWNQSETCIAPRRVFVPAQLAPELEKRLAAVAGELSNRERRTRPAKVAAALLQNAVGRGARLVAGRILPGNEGITPAVLAAASPAMPLLQEDVFAPVVSLVSVRDEEEALRQASQCPYALGATIFGTETRAEAFAARVHAGSIVINDLIVPTADPRLPFGGRGKSGFGVTRGAEGLLDLTTVKVVTVRRGGFQWHLAPPDSSDARFFRDYTRAVHGDSWRKRLAAWGAVIRTLIARARNKNR